MIVGCGMVGVTTTQEVGKVTVVFGLEAKEIRREECIPHIEWHGSLVLVRFQMG